MKTLYISDLDGTLLNANAELSDYTINTLTRLIDNGMHFSIATARTIATAKLMLQNVPINVPIILMNGVLVYDLQKKQYIKKEMLAQDKTVEIVSAIEKTGVTGFMFTLTGNTLMSYYQKIANIAMQEYVDERVQKFNKKFMQIDNFSSVTLDIIYFCFIDSAQNIERLHKEINHAHGIRIEKYQDIYCEDIWYMEVFSDTASKRTAVEFLRTKYNFDKIVGFGDNLNDLPLFSASDECYAVANAKLALKESATDVIGTNTENGVAKWLEQNVSCSTNKKL